MHSFHQIYHQDDSHMTQNWWSYPHETSRSLCPYPVFPSHSKCGISSGFSQRLFPHGSVYPHSHQVFHSKILLLVSTHGQMRWLSSILGTVLSAIQFPTWTRQSQIVIWSYLLLPDLIELWWLRRVSCSLLSNVPCQCFGWIIHINPSQYSSVSPLTQCETTSLRPSHI